MINFDTTENMGYNAFFKKKRNKLGMLAHICKPGTLKCMSLRPAKNAQ